MENVNFVISKRLLIICGVNQKASFKVDVRKFNNHSVFYMLSLPLCWITNSNIDSSWSHASYDWQPEETSQTI